MTIEKDAILRDVRSAVGLGLCAALFLAGCSEEPTMPLDDTAGSERPGALADVVQRLDCTVDLSKGGALECGPASGAGRASTGGPNYNLVVGSQHRYVRMANNDAPVIEDDVWSADVTVQNLTLQPFGTLDGTTAEAAGVRVFFVDEPNNGVEVLNHDGEATFTEAVPQKYYEYSGALLGGDEVLMPGETSGAKTWQFALNGATKFRFSVLVWTEVPDPDAYSVRLTRISAGYGHTCGHDLDGKLYCWGDNRYGQLGDGTRIDRLTPVAVQVPTAHATLTVSAGHYHACGLSVAGPAYCWGSNVFGQHGDGRTINNAVPVFVAGTY